MGWAPWDKKLEGGRWVCAVTSLEQKIRSVVTLVVIGARKAEAGSL
jgi:hypothetical protein